MTQLKLQSFSSYVQKYRESYCTTAEVGAGDGGGDGGSGWGRGGAEVWHRL